LRRAQQAGSLQLAEVALYGAQVHAVVPVATAAIPRIESMLHNEGVAVDSIGWIAPSLEDVFISQVSAADKPASDL